MHSKLIAVHEGKNVGIDDYEDDMKGKITCKFCNSKLIAKRGKILIHHFAHVTLENCDNWYYGEKSKWHTMWQNICDSDSVEYIIKKDGIKHIADIYYKDKDLVIEIQKSCINSDDIKNREEFYGNMLWIVRLGDIEPPNIGNNFVILKTQKKFFREMTKDVYFDSKYGLFKRVLDLKSGYYVCEMVNTKLFLKDKFIGVLKKSVKKTVKKLSKNIVDCPNYQKKCQLQKNNKCFKFDGTDCWFIFGDILKATGLIYSNVTKKVYLCKCGKCEDNDLYDLCNKKKYRPMFKHDK